MSIFLEIILNPALIVPAASWIIAQILKAIINAIVTKQFSFSRLVGDGGMPSGHSATVSALAVICGLMDGFDSATFGLACIFAIVVMHDALGVRRETGKQAVSIIKMAEILNDVFIERDVKIKTDKLKTFVGHTPWQVVLGSLLGVGIAVASYFIFPSAF